MPQRDAMSPHPMHAAPLLAALAVACTRGPEPCAGHDVCGRSRECLANRCVPAGGDPVPPDSERVVLHPIDLGVVSKRRAPREEAPLPPAVTFGSAAAGATILLLRFDPTWKELGHVEAAFLLLEPAGSPPGSDVEIEAWLAGGRWSGAALSWANQPAPVLPGARGLARTRPAAPLRVDVTELVLALKDRSPRADHGVLLSAPAGEGYGAAFATGAAGGNPPRLEIYLRPRPPREKARGNVPGR